MKTLMKITVIALAIVIGGLMFTTVNVNAKTTNKSLVKKYCRKNYGKYKVVFFTKWNDKTMFHRKGKKKVYVEKTVSYSTGKKYGWTKEGYFIAYNKKVKKGKRVVSYFIYNPYTNYYDDIVAAVDNKKIR